MSWIHPLRKPLLKFSAVLLRLLPAQVLLQAFLVLSNLRVVVAVKSLNYHSRCSKFIPHRHRHHRHHRPAVRVSKKLLSFLLLAPLPNLEKHRPLKSNPGNFLPRLPRQPIPTIQFWLEDRQLSSPIYRISITATATIPIPIVLLLSTTIRRRITRTATAIWLRPPPNP